MMQDGISLLRLQFEAVAKKNLFSDPIEQLICDEAVEICSDFEVSQIQESWSWRNVHVARELAKALIDERGILRTEALERAIQCFEKHLYSLGPGRELDAKRQEHQLKILLLFREKKEYVSALKRISHPFQNPVAERLIRETLDLSEGIIITDSHARQAVFSALLTYLRQNVGSCFATAPAILIQQDQPLQFLDDMVQLLGQGRLLRVYEGKEHLVPFSPSWGMGDLLRPFYISLLGEQPLMRLALSPGLQAAFSTSELLTAKIARKEKIKDTMALLEECHLQQEISNADQIIRRVLLKKYELTETEIAATSQSPVHEPWGHLAAHTLATGGRSLNKNRYFKSYEMAKNAFKFLTDNALLKGWEFTLASLSESKSDFAKWNLYASLGVNPEEKHGIGEALVEKIQEEIHAINLELQELQSRYDHLFAQGKYLEGRMTHAISERELGWVSAEYQIRRQEIHRTLSERDAAHDRGRKLQGIYSVIIQFYGQQIPHYFQEVYDAEMHDVAVNPYDDSPAGFRLMYKHGRTHAALWTMIYSASEFVQSLTSFFVATENELNQYPELEGLQKEISDLVTAAIMTIKRAEFLEGSFARLAKAYGETLIARPLDHLDQVKRKPWAYISGGTMATLISCYWGNPAKPQESKRWIENENEYLAFLIDSIKEAPEPTRRLYQKAPESCLLAFSPTHAFNCKPGSRLFREAWESDLYTYTWIRDHWMLEQKKFLDNILLDHRMIDNLIQELLLTLPVDYRSLASHALKDLPATITPPDVRSSIIKTLSYQRWLKQGNELHRLGEELDSILYRCLPFFPQHHLEDRLRELFENITELTPHLRQQIYQLIPMAEEHIGKYKILSAQDLKAIAKALLITALKRTRAALDHHHLITLTMRKLNLCYPEPFLFADTNWVNTLFGFVVNPGTRQLELWRFDDYGDKGRPITQWKRYLNGGDRTPWGLYTNPLQYGQHPPN